MARLFGTDGVRGLANVELTPALALELAAAAVVVLGEASLSRGARPTVVVGRDPRLSGKCSKRLWPPGWPRRAPAAR